MISRSEKFISEISRTLDGNILSFWLREMKDPDGGFYPQMTSEGVLVKDAPRGVILNARILWAFSAAYGATQNKDYLLAATHCKDYFLRHFQDNRFGGVYWSVDKDGKRCDAKKQLYAQAFAIYGLSEYYRVCPDDQALKMALNLYKIVQRHFADRVNGGYVEALSRDFSPLEDMSLSDHDINARKTMNSHLHILEAFANLYKVHPTEGLRDDIRSLLDIILGKVMDKATGHLNLYFDDDWTVVGGGFSYGHDIETSWLALEAAFALHDADLINKVKPACRRLADAGLEGMREDGSLIYEVHPDGTPDTSRQWWVEAEALVGNLWLWKYHNDPQAFDRALALWDYIRTHLVDEKGGEWFWSCEQDGTHGDGDKAGFWKCPYHNSRMCLQVLEQL